MKFDMKDIKVAHEFQIKFQLNPMSERMSIVKKIQNLPYSFFRPKYAYNSQTKTDFAFKLWVIVSIIILLLMT